MIMLKVVMIVHQDNTTGIKKIGVAIKAFFKEINGRIYKCKVISCRIIIIQAFIEQLFPHYSKASNIVKLWNNTNTLSLSL